MKSVLRFTAVIGIAVALWVMSGGCGARVAPLVVTMAGHNHQHLTLLKGQKLLVELPGDPSTGFVWRTVEGGLPVLDSLGDSTYEPSGSPSEVGSGGTYTFTYWVADTGSANLQLAYARPSDSSGTAKETFEVQITSVLPGSPEASSVSGGSGK